jgi:hypothetical protein
MKRASFGVATVPAIVARAPGQFLGAFPGPIGDWDAGRHSHRILLDLRIVRDELKGTASAMTLGGLGTVPDDDQRMHFHLPYRVSLKRTSSPSARFRPEDAKKVRMFPEFVEGHDFKF